MSIYRKTRKVKEISKMTVHDMSMDYISGIAIDALRRKYNIHPTHIKRELYANKIISLPRQEEVKVLIEQGVSDAEILKQYPIPKENFSIIKHYAKVPHIKKIENAERNEKIKLLYEMGYNYTMIAGAFGNSISRQRVMQIVQEMKANGEINPR